MKRIALVLICALTASVLAACGSSVGTAPTAFSPQSVRSHTSYNFYIVNHASTILYVVNEPYYGECVSQQFPSTHIEPKTTLSFVVDTLSSGKCAQAVKGGLVTLDYGVGRAVLYVEYTIDPHSENWHVEGFGRGSIISFTGRLRLQPPAPEVFPVVPPA